jgi:Holliday junction resolvase RusA-like endonuclease
MKTTSIMFEFKGRPVGYKSMSNRGNWHPDIKRYHAYREDLTAFIVKQIRAGEWSDWMYPPKRSDKDAWSAYLKKYRFSIFIRVYRATEVGDLTNYLKAIEDSIEQAGLIANDSKIVEHHDLPAIKFGMEVDSKNPRILVQLMRIK